MIQISYQPAYDPFHTAYRLFRLRGRIAHAALGHVRVVDFYLAFPFRLSSVKFKKSDQRCKKVGEAYENRRGYAIQPPPVELFGSMKPVFEAAAQTLTSQSFFEESDFLNGVMTPTLRPLPQIIWDRVEADNERERDLIDCLATLLSYDYLGSDGVKARTGLLEFRNDAT